MAARAASLEVYVSANTKDAESGLSSLGQTVQGTGSKIGALLGAGALAGGAAVAAGLAVGIKAAGDLEQSVANISTIKPEIDTSAVFAGLNEMSTRVPQSSKQLGDAMYNVFSSFNTDTAGAMKLVEQFAQGAVGAQTDAATFGTSILGVMNAYGSSVGDAAHISDVFFNTVNAGVVTGQELASSLGPVTQSAKAAGVSLDELGGLIAGVTKEGGPAAQNINNLNNFLQKVSTKEAQNELHALGVATTDATGKFRPTTAILTDLKVKLGAMTEAGRAAELQKIFPDAQARQGAQTLLSQLDFVKGAIDDNKTSAGSASAAYEKMSATFNSQSQLLMNTMTSILTTVGATVLPAITPLVKAFAEALPGAFRSAQDALGPFVPMIQGAAAVVADAWHTVQQVFAGDWSPDASINPIVNAIGMIATVIRDDVIPAVSAVAGFVAEEFGKVVDWFDENFPLIQKIVEQVLVGMEVFWREHGQNVVAIVQASWTAIKTAIEGGFDIIGSVVHAFLQLLTGDWSGAWDTMVGLGERQAARLGTILGAAFDALLNVIDIATGGMVTMIETWLSDTGQAISDGWNAIATGISSAWSTITTTITDAANAIITSITDAWNQVKDVTDTIHNAIKNVLIAVWDAIYDSVIKPKVDAIETYLSEHWEAIRSAIETKVTAARDLIGTVWDAVSSKTTEVFNAVLTFVRDTIFEPMRAGIEEKINAARDLFGGAVDAVSLKAHQVLDPVLAYWRDTIWEPIRAAVDTAVYGEKGAYTQFSSGVLSIKGVVDGALQGIKTVWETTWAAIQKAAESPKAAMDALIQLVKDLKTIMPEWLIPHSPTPFQVGLEGIMKAAHGMNAAFSGMGGGLEMIQQIAAMATSIGGVDFGQAAAAIAASETGGGRHLVQQGGGGGVGPFQFDPGGELQNFARSLHVSLAEAARVAVAEPGKAAAWALHGYLGSALREGIENGLSGADLADFGSRVGQRPAGDNWKMAGEWFRQLFPGYAAGGWAGLHGPELAWLGDGGERELVTPESDLRSIMLAQASRDPGPMQTIKIVIEQPSGRSVEEIWITGYKQLARRGGLPSTFGAPA